MTGDGEGKARKSREVMSTLVGLTVMRGILSCGFSGRGVFMTMSCNAWSSSLPLDAWTAERSFEKRMHDSEKASCGSDSPVKFEARV